MRLTMIRYKSRDLTFVWRGSHHRLSMRRRGARVKNNVSPDIYSDKARETDEEGERKREKGEG